MSLGTKSFATEDVHDRVHDKVYDKIHDKVHDKVHDKIHDKRSWYQDPGTKIFVPRSLRETVLHEGGTALSTDPNRYPFFTVRTAQASLVGEISQKYTFVGPWTNWPGMV